MTRFKKGSAPNAVLQTTLALAAIAIAAGASFAVDEETSAFLSQPKYTIYPKLPIGEQSADRPARPPIWQQLARPELTDPARVTTRGAESSSQKTASSCPRKQVESSTDRQTLEGCETSRAASKEEHPQQTCHHFNGKRILHSKTPTFGGHADYYSDSLHGHRTASGEPYDRNKLTAAHKHLPLGTHLRVINRHNGRSCVLKVNDRGPFTPGRVIDVSMEAAKQLGLLRGGRMVDCYVVTKMVPLAVPEKAATSTKAQAISNQALLKSKLANSPMSEI